MCCSTATPTSIHSCTADRVRRSSASLEYTRVSTQETPFVSPHRCSIQNDRREVRGFLVASLSIALLSSSYPVVNASVCFPSSPSHFAGLKHPWGVAWWRTEHRLPDHLLNWILSWPKVHKCTRIVRVHWMIRGLHNKMGLRTWNEIPANRLPWMTPKAETETAAEFAKLTTYRYRVRNARHCTSTYVCGMSVLSAFPSIAQQERANRSENNFRQCGISNLPALKTFPFTRRRRAL